MRSRTKIRASPRPEESMATAVDQEIVHKETTVEPTATPTEAPTSPVGATSVSRTSLTSVHDADYTGRVVPIIWWIVGFVDVVLIIRFLLKLLGGSTVSGFVRFMYDITQFLVAPFHGIFNTAVQGRSILEPESLVAIVIYSLIGWGIVSLIRMMTRPRGSAGA
jgi:YGGT family